MAQQVNRLLYDYIHTDQTLYHILLNKYDPEQYLECVMLEVAQEIHNKHVKQEILVSIDRAIRKGHPIPDIFLLFLASSILYMCLYDQLEKANSLSAIGSSMLDSDINPMIKSFFMQAQAKLFRVEGNVIRSVELLNESVKNINRNHSRFNILVSNKFTVLATQGMLKEKGEYLDTEWREPISKFHDLNSIESKLTNCVVTCSYESGIILAKQYKSLIKEEVPFRIYLFESLLHIFNGELDETKYGDDFLKLYVNILDALAISNIEGAMKNYQKFLQTDWHQVYMRSFVDYLPLHFELCLGKRASALTLLQEKQKQGNIHYLDDLFLGRIRLLENDKNGANIVFQRLISQVQKYDARERLLFELQFAKEMKLQNVLSLMNGWQNIEQIVMAKPKPEMEQSKPMQKIGVNLIVGHSNTILQVKQLIKKYSLPKTPVLITGETGTGKELVAKALHDEGQNFKEPFLAINCGALTESLLQSELFGYEAGAFTGAHKARPGIFEAAGNGTVFLDEFGDISHKLQVSLLRVLESGEIRPIGGARTRKIQCKIVVATNVDLQEAVMHKKFREDLYFRLTQLEIRLPTLRERKDDLTELIKYFLEPHISLNGAAKKFTLDLINALKQYDWPGNIRELKNEIDRTCVLNPLIDEIGLKDFDFTHIQPVLLKNHTTKAQETNEEQESTIIGNNEYTHMVMSSGFPIENRHNRLKELFKRYGKMTRSQVMQILKVGSSTATKDLQALTNQNLIVRRRPTNSPRTDYFEWVASSKDSGSK